MDAFLNTRNKQKPLHRKVRMLNPSISASMGLSSINRAKQGMAVLYAHSRWQPHRPIQSLGNAQGRSLEPSFKPPNKSWESLRPSHQLLEMGVGRQKNKCVRVASSKPEDQGSEDSTPQRAKALRKKKISKQIRTFHLIPITVWSWRMTVSKNTV